MNSFRGFCNTCKTNDKNLEMVNSENYVLVAIGEKIAKIAIFVQIVSMEWYITLKQVFEWYITLKGGFVNSDSIVLINFGVETPTYGWIE